METTTTTSANSESRPGGIYLDAVQALETARQRRDYPMVSPTHVRVAKALALARDLTPGGWVTQDEVVAAVRTSRTTGYLRVNEIGGLVACHAPGWRVVRRRHPDFRFGRTGGVEAHRWQFRLERA